MPQAVRPSNIAACVPGPQTTIADAIKKVDIQLPVLFYLWYATIFNADGTLTDTFKSNLCAALKGCPPKV